MTFGSLFAGIGGFDLGLERAGMTPKWQVEIDPFCRAVLAKHWPDVRRYEDVQECCGGLLRRSHDDQRCAECGRRDWLSWVDLICGGFPCQDISPAGRRAGIHGKQSGLWAEFHRIIRELRPRYVVVENSSNLLADGFGMDVVIGSLAAIGYDAEWDCIPVAAFGAPHERERVFIVAYPRSAERRPRHPQGQHTQRPNDHSHGSQDRQSAEGATVAKECAEVVSDADVRGCERSRLPVSGLTRQSGADAERPRTDVAHTDQARPPLVLGCAAFTELARFRTAHSGPWWRTEPKVVRVVHGVSGSLVRRREGHSSQIGALGNAVSPFIPEWIGRRVMQIEADRVA